MVLKIVMYSSYLSSKHAYVLFTWYALPVGRLTIWATSCWPYTYFLWWESRAQTVESSLCPVWFTHLDPWISATYKRRRRLIQYSSMPTPNSSRFVLSLIVPFQNYSSWQEMNKAYTSLLPDFTEQCSVHVKKSVKVSAPKRDCGLDKHSVQ